MVGHKAYRLSCTYVGTSNRRNLVALIPVSCQFERARLLHKIEVGKVIGDIKGFTGKRPRKRSSLVMN